MYIDSMKLENFRNYESQEIEFNKNINVFFGDNAQGKTNILESIYLCALGRAFRTRRDNELINFSQKNALVKMNYIKSDREGKIEINIFDKKYIKINDIKCKKMSELLGKINVVLFCPDDLKILKEGPSERRKFLDIMISSLRPNYVFALNKYIKVLEQRNILLRQIKFNQAKIDNLDIWDIKIAELGNKLYNYRKEFVEKLNKKIYNIHNEFSKESIKIEYLSDCTDYNIFLDNLKKTREKDVIRGYTQIGIHKDDLIFYINDKKVNVYASQGQCRSVVLSLKFSELEVIYEEIGEYPILLLDDVMSELDEKRKLKLIEIIKNYQVIITSTEKEIFKSFTEKIKYFHIAEGKIKECFYI